jgi:hypothetical protein
VGNLSIAVKTDGKDTVIRTAVTLLWVVDSAFIAEEVIMSVKFNGDGLKADLFY